MLFEYAGTMAVYGDVDRKLQRCMGRMQEWVEACDFGARQRWGREQMAGIREGEPPAGGAPVRGGCVAADCVRAGCAGAANGPAALPRAAG